MPSTNDNNQQYFLWIVSGSICMHLEVVPETISKLTTGTEYMALSEGRGITLFPFTVFSCWNHIHHYY